MSSSAASTIKCVAFVGLGKIGFAIAKNVITKSPLPSSTAFTHFDINTSICDQLAEETSSKTAASIADAVTSADIVFTALPNDAILFSVSRGEGGVISSLQSGAIHVSCSTVSPDTSRAIAKEHEEQGAGFVCAPVFARPDGMILGHATIPVSGAGESVQRVLPLLNATATEVRTGFGSDPGAANVVKLAGNFLIASAIESMGEAFALSEAQGVDREAVRSLLTDTIFDCLIYTGYGQRVARRDHAPYPNAHFALDLGCKDVELVRQTAASVNVPMPVASLLGDRFSSAVAKGRSDLDWSAVGLASSEDAGVDVSEEIERCRRPNPKIDWKPPT
jgi:3-hydroxyisobutyrate dehydrogenase-like beta-hydroxyacid dehydrogenase